MRERLLKPSTIIPSELYIERDADRQLQSIIEDMGRPGCILVARQMGKTNLLLHAKKKLENDQHTFVYVDLSTHMESAQECFRNIIDVAIEANINKFEEIGEVIYAKRTNNNLSPVKEHERELRLLLTSVLGKLIIILDEIDALTNAKYSDKIFAQIRSTYFAGRTNYEEFNRLTYILSGVLEPTEIIANKKISPFNIADKIFLEDFSFEEFHILLDKAKLNFPKKITEHIYNWTKGNPRITWDLCSRLEELALNSTEITISEIDKVVNSLYLKDFDRAPIDHIRELVEADSKIRDAVIVLKYNKGETLSDSIKKKLYLAGIIGANYGGSSNLQIKNRVILECLSDSWIESVERAEKDLYVLATEKIVSKRYKGAIDLLLEYLGKTQLSDDVRFAICNDLSFCYYNLSLFKEAINYSRTAQKLIDKDSSKQFYYNCEHRIALCNYHLRNFEEAVTSYGHIIDEYPKGIIYLRALLTRSSCYITINPSQYYSKIKADYDIILNAEYENYGNDKKDIEQLKAITYYNLAYLDIELKFFEKKEELINYLNLAISLTSDEGTKPKMYLLLISLLEDSTQKKQIIEKCINIIIDNKLGPNSLLSGLTLHFNDFYALVIHAFNEDIRFSIIERLVLYGSVNFTPLDFQLSINSYILYATVFYKYSLEISIEKPLSYLLKVEDLNKIEKLDLYQAVVIRAIDEKQIGKNKEFIDKYIETLNSIDSLNRSINSDDLKLYSDLSNVYFEKNELFKVISLSKVFLENENFVNADCKGDFILVYNNATITNYRLYKKYSDDLYKKEAIKFANISISYCRSANSQSISLLGEQALNTVIDSSRQILNFLGKKISTIRRERPKLRNNEKIRVKYHDGNIEKEGKYKKFRKDIESEKCIVVKRFSA